MLVTLVACVLLIMLFDHYHRQQTKTQRLNTFYKIYSWLSGILGLATLFGLVVACFDITVYTIILGYINFVAYLALLGSADTAGNAIPLEDQPDTYSEWN